MSARRLLLSPLLLLAPSCGADATPNPGALPAAGSPAGIGSPQPGGPLAHDFGTVRHGTSPTADIRIPLPDNDTDWVPLGYLGSCRCTAGAMILRDRATGEEKVASGQPLPEYAVGADRDLILRLSLHTMELEPMDHPIARHPGRVVLQRLGHGAMSRVEVPITVRYGVQSPVRVLPSPVVDFGEVPISRPLRLEVMLNTADAESPIGFGPAKGFDARLKVELAAQPEADGHRLTLTFTPDPKDPFRALKTAVEVATDHGDDYRVILPVSAVGVPDLQVKPTPRLSFGAFDFGGGPEVVASRSLLVVDHSTPDADVEVVAVTDQQGRDASRFFSCTVQPAASPAADANLVVRYLGGLEPPSFRGEIELKSGKKRCVVELMAFHLPPR